MSANGFVSSPNPITVILRLEGLVLLTIAVYAYYRLDDSWLLFILLLFVFDISMVGYLSNPRLGSITYNLGHNAVLPGMLALAAWANGWRGALIFSLIWLAHIGVDRLLGYGLKNPDDFKHTHLGWIGGGRRKS